MNNKGPDLSFQEAKGQNYMVLWDGNDFVDFITYGEVVELNHEQERKLREFTLKLWEKIE